MAKLATDIELLCQNIKVSSNTVFQIRKSSSSIYANIREGNYGQSKADMLSKFEIALKINSFSRCRKATYRIRQYISRTKYI